MRIALAAVGLGLFLAVWQAVGHYRLAGLSWPSLTEVLAVLSDPDRRPLFGRALAATLSATALGYCAGLLIGLGAAGAPPPWPAPRPRPPRPSPPGRSVPPLPPPPGVFP